MRALFQFTGVSGGASWEVAKLYTKGSGMTVDYSWPELETLTHQVNVLSQYSWLRWQSWVASLEMGVATELQTARQGLLDALIVEDLDHIQCFLEPRLSQFSPSQWEVMIASLPLAWQRALTSLCLIQMTISPAVSEIALRSYALSGAPLILDVQGSLDLSTSAQIVKAILTTQISRVSVRWIVAVLGSKTLRKLGWQEGNIPSADNGDPWLGLTQVGIQVSQLSEFVALRIQTLLNSGLGTIPPLLPYQPIVALVRWLTSDPLLSISNLTEFSLVAASQERRLELLCQQLHSQDRLPKPGQLQSGIPEVLALIDADIRILVAKQLLLIGEALDPQERSDWINQLGRNLNHYNPLQYLEAWNGQVWLNQLLEHIDSLQTSYPTLTLWEPYAAGIRQALELPKVMDQAEVLRQTALTLAPDLKEG